MFKPAVVVVLLVAAISNEGFGGQAAVEPRNDEPNDPVLRVEGEIERPLKLQASDLADLPRTTVQATDRDGTQIEFEGVPLFEILQRAGAPLGERLRGEAVALYVVVGASDGYQAVFALSECDPAITDRVVILADRRDGQPMTEPQGPFRIVVPDEKRQVRWVRMVETLTVHRAPRLPEHPQ